MSALIWLISTTFLLTGGGESLPDRVRSNGQQHTRVDLRNFFSVSPRHGDHFPRFAERQKFAELRVELLTLKSLVSVLERQVKWIKSNWFSMENTLSVVVTNVSTSQNKTQTLVHQLHHLRENGAALNFTFETLLQAKLNTVTVFNNLGTRLSSLGNNLTDCKQNMTSLATRLFNLTPVAFLAENNSTLPAPLTSVPFGTALVNLGSAFDRTTGVFTAPRTGTYYFAYNGISDDHSGNVNASLSRNNGGILSSGFGLQGRKTARLSSLLKLNANDTVYLGLSSGQFYEAAATLYHYGQFIGFSV